ncbi:MAG TPA: hypothetical protein VFK78_04275 [Gemmatimonadales bacterium]|nr:hypothetical protein [Gemmatimonadales bacterium]
MNAPTPMFPDDEPPLQAVEYDSGWTMRGFVEYTFGADSRMAGAHPRGFFDVLDAGRRTPVEVRRFEKSEVPPVRAHRAA